jgi:uncharacterized membrane protein
MSDDREVESWLRRLQWALASLPQAESDDIAAETRVHISELLAQGISPREALMRFGAAESYAAGFVEERELVGAAGSQKIGAMLGAVARRAHRNVVAALSLFAVAGLAGIAFLAVLTAIVKIEDPVHAGLWRGQTQFFIGMIDDPITAHELLGNWIYPLAAFSVAVAWLAGRYVLVWAVKRLARRP